MTRPRVLVLDDDPHWTTVIKDTLEPEIEVHTTNNTENWNIQIGGPRWDAIIVDVEILGSEDDGVILAEKAIRDYSVTSPIIIITGVANLEEIETEYKKIFFKYISKNNFNEILVNAVNEATSLIGKHNHMWNMILGIAKKHKLLEKVCDDSRVAEYAEVCPSIGNQKSRTLQQIIIHAQNTPGQNSDFEIGRSILSIIYYELEH